MDNNESSFFFFFNLFWVKRVVLINSYLQHSMKKHTYENMNVCTNQKQGLVLFPYRKHYLKLRSYTNCICIGNSETKRKEEPPNAGAYELKEILVHIVSSLTVSILFSNCNLSSLFFFFIFCYVFLFGGM